MRGSSCCSHAPKRGSTSCPIAINASNASARKSESANNGTIMSINSDARNLPAVKIQNLRKAYSAWLIMSATSAITRRSRGTGKWLYNDATISCNSCVLSLRNSRTTSYEDMSISWRSACSNSTFASFETSGTKSKKRPRTTARFTSVISGY